MLKTYPIISLVARAAPDGSIISGADPTQVSTSDPIRLFIIQASIVIIFTRILAYFLAKIKQPSVIAEVIGGIILGPTVFGRIPGFTDHIFPLASIPYFNLVANLGLVLFLFLVGLEIDTRIVRQCGIAASTISLAGLLIPFGLGSAVSVGIYKDFIDQSKVSLGHFLLFTGVAMAITALPVLARIVLDLKLIKTKVGVVVLAAGVGNDVVGWILLALAIALVNASSGLAALYIFLVVVAWCLLLFFLIRPCFVWLARRDGSLSRGPTHLMMTLTILLVFASSFLTDCIGVHAIFGAFLVGLIIPHEGGFAVALTEKLEDMVSIIFLPLYFALSGLRTNLGTLDTGLIWGYVIAICLIAFFSKFIACAAAARLTGFNNRESAAVGTLMSCKGLVELIVLNLGLSAGILDTRVFSMFVVMAIVSTCLTTPLTMLVYPKRFQTFFTEEDFKKKDESRRQGDDEAGESADTVKSKSFAKRYLFVLDRFDDLPGLLNVVQVLRPSSDLHLRNPQSRATNSVRRRNNASTEKGDESGVSESSHEDNVPVLLDGQTSRTIVPKAPASVDALRLMELTERTSAVMKVAEYDETLQADPLVNVFRAFVRLNRLPIQTAMQVVPIDEFSSTVVTRAQKTKSDLVILPWTLSSAGLLGNDQNETGLLRGPVERFFGTGSSDISNVARYYQAAFVRKVIQTSPCHVGMLLERSTNGQITAQSSSSYGWGQHVVFAFMGGPDDRCALELLQEWCKVNVDVYATIYRYRKSDADLVGNNLNSPPMTMQNVDTVHRTQAANAVYGNMSVHDTMYPDTNLNPLQAQLQDDIAIEAILKICQNDQDLGRRLRIFEKVTPTPLAHLVETIGTQEKTTGEQNESQNEIESESLPPASLILLGRNRRLPTITHRDELRALLRKYDASSTQPSSSANQIESRLIDGEMSKIVGQAALAVCGIGKCTLPVLIVASSLHQRVIGEDE